MLYRKYYLYRAQPFFAGSKRKREGGIRLELIGIYLRGCAHTGAGEFSVDTKCH